MPCSETNKSTNQPTNAKGTPSGPTNAKGIASGPTNAPTLLEAYSILSSSECRVLKKMVEGKANRQIATELFINKKTVENHITNIGKKLKLSGSGNVRKWLRTIARK